MKIIELETLLIDEFPNLVYVRVHTDEGLSGLGETFYGARAVSAWIHETAAPYLLGKDPLQIDRHWQGLNGFVGFNSTGVENRGRSAIDFALWDILGQVCGQPIYQLLGGASRERIRAYNTCAGYRYVRNVPRAGGLPVENWGSAANEGPYEDLDAFMHRAGELADSLLEQGITGMKIWPFDPYAEASNGHYISAADLKKGLEPFRKIREAVGERIDIMVEMHSLWDLPCAIKIASALEEYQPFWFEDPVRMDNLEAVTQFARATRVPTTASETLGTRWSFRALLEQHAVGIVMFDPAWTGGITEGKKVASMAEAYQLPVAPHDCTGPVEFTAAVHLSINAPNALIQETVRAFYTGWYSELVTAVPQVRDGYVYPLTAPGLGTTLRPEVLTRTDVHRQSSHLTDH
ncbi:MAG: mandelate racemase/muconate lactonizing enzyme family protein [Ktedonobacteraceae bacterium]